MEKITKQNIEKEIHTILDTKEMSCANLERFVLLSEAMKYIDCGEREFTAQDAKEWVDKMYPPARWSMDQTTAVMRQRNLHYKPFVFWAIMNSLVSDYGKTMAKHGADKTEVWADLAVDWLDDHDAVEDKAGHYFRDIVKR